MSFIPGLGLVKGMALTLLRFFEPKATIRYPEEPAAISAKFRGRLQLLYDEYGTLKCETCFQCAQACPVECIDMGGIDTKTRYHVHWGAAETFGERREESALRRSGRTVPDAAYTHFDADDLSPVDEILEDNDFDPGQMLQILEATQQRYGYLPVAALKRISHRTGAWYAMIYGTATYYGHLRFEPAEAAPQAAAMAERRPTEATYLAAFETALAGSAGGVTSRGKSASSKTAGGRTAGGRTAGGKTTGGKTTGGRTTGRPDGRGRGRTQA